MKRFNGTDWGKAMYPHDEIANIITRHQDTVYRVAFTYCKNRADAADVTQEVFYRFLKNRSPFENDGHVKAWLIKVAINTSKSLLRSSWFCKRERLSETEAAKDADNTDDNVRRAVLALPVKYRSVVYLYYFEGYSVKETAGILRRTETAVQTQLQRARAMLKKLLSEEWDNE
jgi:RNA polymerase sigma-70 factor (ECF subfamily)